MAKIFNGVKSDANQNVITKVQKMDNGTAFDNAEKMEKTADLLEVAEPQANAMFEACAFKCFIQALRTSLKNDPNRATLTKLYIKAYRLTSGFSVILTESENKDNALKENTKVNGRTYWHKPLPQKTPHFYFQALKSGVKVAKQFAILKRKQDKVLSFEALFATKYAQISAILTPEQREQIYKSYIDGLGLDN